MGQLQGCGSEAITKGQGYFFYVAPALPIRQGTGALARKTNVGDLPQAKAPVNIKHRLVTDGLGYFGNTHLA